MNVVVHKGHVYIKQSYRDEDGKGHTRIVDKLGRLEDLEREDPDCLKKLKEKYARPRLQRREEQLLLARRAAAEISGAKAAGREIRSPCVSYAGLILRQLWEKELGLDYRIGYLAGKDGIKKPVPDLAAFLAFSRITEPRSVRGSFPKSRTVLGSRISDCSLDDLYDTLGFLSARKDEILKWIGNRIGGLKSKGKLMLFYDVTNIYFETALSDEEKGLLRSDRSEEQERIIGKFEKSGELTDAMKKADGGYDPDLIPPEVKTELLKACFLRMRGFSKEKRFDLPLVSVSLVIDENGVPLDFVLYRGNQAEITGMENSMELLQGKYDLKGMVTVADRGLNSVSNLKMLQDHGMGYIVAQKISDLSKEITEKILGEEGYEDCGEGLRRKVIENFEKTNGEESVTCTMLVTFSKTRAARDLKKLEQDKAAAEKAVKNHAKIPGCRQPWCALVKKQGKDKVAWQLNTAAYEKRKKLCGYSAAVYASPADGGAKVTPDDAARSYHSLVRIEECFRIMKTDLSLRPAYVWTSEHIRGYVMCCVLALILIRMIEQKTRERGTPMTVSEIVYALRDARSQVFRGADGTLLFSQGAAYEEFAEELMRRGNEETAEDIRAKKLKTDLEKLEEALGLEPLPGLCDKAALGHAFHSRFDSDQDLLGEFVCSLLKAG